MSCAFSECRELFAASPGTGVKMHENWLEATRYLNMDHLKEHKKEALRVVRLTAARRERRCPTRRLCAASGARGSRGRTGPVGAGRPGKGASARYRFGNSIQSARASP